MKSQKGLTDEFFLFPLAIILVILATVAIPNFMRARDRAKRIQCVQALEVLRDVMKTYASSHPRKEYPVALNKRIYQSNPDVQALSLLGEYTNVTETFHFCRQTAFEVKQNKYTITAIAIDRSETVLTATADAIIQP